MRHAIVEESQLSCAGRMRRKDQGCALELTTWGVWVENLVAMIS